MLICCLKTNFLNLQLEITDKFRPTIIGIYGTKVYTNNSVHFNSL